MTPETPPASRPPAGAMRLMIAILVTMALLAIYANVQRARRDKIETVEVKMISPSPSATPLAVP